MNFKQALIAHLQGEMVQKRAEWKPEWMPFTEGAESVTLAQVLEPGFGSNCEFRLSPRTIRVNGVEVAAPESVAPSHGSDYYLPNFGYSDCLHEDLTWTDHEFDLKSLKRGLVYLNKDDAIARAKAMLLTQE